MSESGIQRCTDSAEGLHSADRWTGRYRGLIVRGLIRRAGVQLAVCLASPRQRAALAHSFQSSPRSGCLINAAQRACSHAITFAVIQMD